MGNIVQLPLSDDMLSKMQSQDTYCSHIKTLNRKGKYQRGTNI